MAFIPVPNTCRVELVFSQEGQFCENVFHVKQAAPFDAAALASVAAAFVSWHGANLKTMQVSTCSLIKIIATALDSESAPGIEYATGLPVVGTRGNAAMPMNVTVAVKWLTALRGKSFRGRSYHIGLDDQDVTLSALPPASVSAMRGAYFPLIAATAGWVPGLVVVSYRTNNEDRMTGLASEILDCSVDSTVDSQRRRLPGRGS